MPKLAVDRSVDEAPSILRRLRMLVGHSELKRLLDGVHASVSRRRVASQRLANLYAIPLGLRRAFDYERSTGRSLNPTKDPGAYAACTFALAAVSLADVLSEKGKARLSGMLRHALSVDGDARRLDHELGAAAHFTLNGWDVTPIDMESAGVFDYVVSRDDVGADVECKAVNGDKGNPIHMIDAMNFMEFVGPRLSRRLSNALWTIDLVFDDGLPRDPQGQTSLVETVLSAIDAGATRHDFPGGSVALRREPMPALRGKEELDALALRREYELQERLNGHACCIYDRDQVIALGTSSLRPSRVVEYTGDEIKKGCEQLTKGCAGFVWTHFMDITDAEMRALAESATESGLDAISKRMFKQDSRLHVSVLGYSGEPSVRKLVDAQPGKLRTSYMKRGLLKVHRSNRTTFPLPEDFPTVNRT